MASALAICNLFCSAVETTFIRVGDIKNWEYNKQHWCVLGNFDIVGRINFYFVKSYI